MLLFQAPLEIILELCRDLRRDRNGENPLYPEEFEVEVRMESAKILVISHDISLRDTRRSTQPSIPPR